jgi:hypothetical protein
MTVNCSQGQTLENVILAISKQSLTSCDFKYNGIYVAFSRVKSKNNIRLLLVGNSEASKWESVRYIMELKPHPFCSTVISGWSRKDGDRWINNEWSSIESRKAYTKSVPKKRERFTLQNKLDTYSNRHVFSYVVQVHNIKQSCTF